MLLQAARVVLTVSSATCCTTFLFHPHSSSTAHRESKEKKSLDVAAINYKCFSVTVLAEIVCLARSLLYNNINKKLLHLM